MRRSQFSRHRWILEVGGEDYHLDLLFYHLKLRCFVVLDLEMEAFKLEFAGKMNFYLKAVDEQMRHAHAHTEDQLVGQPAIGLFAGFGWAVAGPPPTASGSGEPRDAGLLGRETTGEVVLGFHLRAALEKLVSGQAYTL